MATIIRGADSTIYSLLKESDEIETPYTADVVGDEDFKVFQCPTNKFAMLNLIIEPKTKSTIELYIANTKFTEWVDHEDKIIVENMIVGSGQSVFLITRDESSSYVVGVSGLAQNPSSLSCLQ